VNGSARQELKTCKIT